MCGAINCLDGPRNVEALLGHIVYFLDSLDLECVQECQVGLSHLVTIILFFLCCYVRWVRKRAVEITIDNLCPCRCCRHCSGAGGPRREFLQLACREMVQPEWGLFEETSSGYIITTSDMLVEKRHYFVSGLLCGNP